MATKHFDATIVGSRDGDLYARLFDKFPALIWRSGVDAKCDYFNQTWLDFTGRSLEQEMGDGWANGVHPEDLEGCLQSYLKAFHSRQPFTLEYRLRRHDGEYRWIIDHGRPLRDLNGIFAGYLGSCFDITERKLGELDSIRLAAIVNSSDDAIIGKNLNSVITNWNMGAERIFGYTAGEMVGTSILRLIPADRQQEENHILGKIRRGESVKHFETRRQTKDGRLINVSITASPIKDAAGKIIGVSKVARDITDRKQAEAALKESHAQLRALAARLHSAREDESRRISREIHDELGQALTSLNMDLNWIQQKLKEEKSPLLRPQLQRRMRAMTALLESTVRSVQRIATELRPHMLDDFGLTATLEWQAEEFERRTGIHCRWKPKPAVVHLHQDQAVAFLRIFQEILTNVGRHASARSVGLRLVQKNADLILEVADDGRGFDEKKLLAHKSLGLLGMRERVAFTGGHVEVCSAPGKGTRVTVVSPIAKPGKRRKLKADAAHGKKN